MNVGDYVRTKNGINKIVYIDDVFGSDGKHSFYTIRLDNDNLIYDDEIIKSSPNIIDLIQVGDYVNGQKVTNEMIKMRDEQGVFGMPDKYHAFINEIKIKSIVTREQFSQMEYKVGE